MIDMSTIFRRKLTDKIERSSHRSHRSVSTAAGLSHASVNAMINPTSKAAQGPGVFNVARVCAELDTGIDELLGISECGRPSFNGLISRWADGKGNISAFEDVLDFITVFEMPEKNAKSIHITHLGKSSLAVKKTGINSRFFFQETMNKFSNREARQTVIRDFCEMRDKDIDISIQALSVPKIAHMLRPVKINYQRLLLATVDDDHNRQILSYALPI